MSTIFVTLIRFHPLQDMSDSGAHEVGLNPEQPSRSSVILRPDEIRRITGDCDLTIDRAVVPNRSPNLPRNPPRSPY